MIDPAILGGRLSLASGDPAPVKDQVAKSTLYYTPDIGLYTSLYTGSAWRALVVTEVSLALSGLTSGALYDVFLDYNDGTPQLVLQIWAGAGTVITDATNATPMVLTSTAHPYQNGDQVYVEGVRDSTNETIPYAADGTWIVANRAANTLELAGSVGVAAYFRGGVISGRLAAALLTRQDGVWVKAADPQQRYLGTLRTTGTTTTEDSEYKRFVWNAENVRERHLRKQDTDNHVVNGVLASGSSGYRVWQEGGVNSTRVEFIQGLGGYVTKLSQRGAALGLNNSHLPMQIGLNAVPRVDYSTSSQVFAAAGCDHTQPGTFEFCRAIQAGYHYADIMEAEVNSVNCTVSNGLNTGVVWA